MRFLKCGAADSKAAHKPIQDKLSARLRFDAAGVLLLLGLHSNRPKAQTAVAAILQEVNCARSLDYPIE